MREFIIGLLAGFCGAVGIGGGTVLMLYLTMFAGVGILQARTVNLAFFLPCAVTATAFHAKHHLLRFKLILAALVLALTGVFLGFLLEPYLMESVIKKLFAVLLIILALKQLNNLKKNKKDISRNS